MKWGLIVKMKTITKAEFNQLKKIGYAGVCKDNIKRMLILDEKLGTISVPIEVKE